ncbi:zinc knuckle [Cooperia oncophora]
MSDDDIPMDADIERLLLEEFAPSDQIASMKASIDTLVGTVKDLACKNALQVRVSRDIMSDKIQILRDMPKTILSCFNDYFPLEKTQEVEQTLSTLFEPNLKTLQGELRKLDFVRERLHSLGSLIDKLIPVSLTEILAQAEHDDSCMRELAHLLDVDTMQVVDKVSELVKTVSRKNMTENAVTPLVLDSSVQVPQQSAVSSSAVPNPAAIEQLNRFEFEPVDYHATFDPIAAAQARKDEQAAAEAEGIPLDNPDTRAPRSVKQAGFKAIVEALCDKFKENESSAQLNAYMKLKTLRKEGDVTSYCVELEKITQRAYPGASEEELSRTRASELVAQLSDWPEYLQLYTAMERNADLQKRTVHRPRQKQNAAPAPLAVQIKDNQAPASHKKLPKCYKCNEYGHFSRDCKKTVAAKAAASTEKTGGTLPNAPSVFTASAHKRLSIMEETSSTCKGLVGERMTKTVKLLGLSRKALLDTGSQISIIPLEVLRAGRTSGFNFDEDVEEFPLPSQAPIYDASGNKMQFEGAVRLTIELERGEKRRVALFVKAGGDNTLVLGTNALQTLGVSLLTDNANHNQGQHLEDTRPTVTADEAKGKTRVKERRSPTTSQAVVAKRTYLRPGETKLLPYDVPTNKGRTLLGVDNVLNLRYRCNCGLFGQMAHVALPGLTHPMARSKKVLDMFQLANVASIAEQACWGDERKEEELRKKSSCYITPYGLALAIDAHRRRCITYADAVESARGLKFDHPAVFSWPVPYDLGAHLTTAIALQGKLRVPGAQVDREPEIFIALPPAFARVNSDVDYGRNVTPYVYADWNGLAEKLVTMPIVTSLIVVWPDTTPESREMRQVLIALERHLQPGGSLAFFPSPYEDDNNTEWMHMGRVCAEYVRYMTDPQRSFEAIVRDHYSDVLEGAPFTHPAACLGTHPRRGRSQFGGYQIRLFLDKLRVTINDLVKMDEFEMASEELRERRQREKQDQRRRRREERMPNFFVIRDPERVRHNRPISFRRHADVAGPSTSRRRYSPTGNRRSRSKGRSERHGSEAHRSSHRGEHRHESRHTGPRRK